ncbi:MAG TPA: hypothetical protein GXX51_07010 [Firmicutes bacterium]|nr:hypothetical protein [Bacillota bacterium]
MRPNLTDDDIVKDCEICERAGADYVETSTGFGTSGATIRLYQVRRDSNGGDCGLSHLVARTGCIVSKLG